MPPGPPATAGTRAPNRLVTERQRVAWVVRGLEEKGLAGGGTLGVAGTAVGAEATLKEASEAITQVARETSDDEAGERVNPEGPVEVVLDKGYHSGEVLVDMKERAVRSYCSEPDRGRRRWQGKSEEQAAVYANR